MPEIEARPAVSEVTGKVQTVLGTIDPVDIGVTLPHEHLFMVA